MMDRAARQRRRSLNQLPSTTPPSLSTMHLDTRQNSTGKTKTKELPFYCEMKGFYFGAGNQKHWLTPLTIVVTVISAYVTGPQSLHRVLRPVLFLSYRLKDREPVDSASWIDQIYAKGPFDLCFILFYTVLFSFIRDFVMQEVLARIAGFYGLSGSKKRRFMEQCYTFLYCCISSSVGLWLMYHSPMWFFKTEEFYRTYPHRTSQSIFKLYYLLQASFWLQHAVVLSFQLEKPRKDFRELVLHHIVTLGLIFLSYRFHFTWIGLAVFVTMDVSDIFLALSKTLNYVSSPLTVPSFICFVFVWFYARHILSTIIIWSVLTEFRTVGPYYLSFSEGVYKCWLSMLVTASLLISLEGLNSFWSFLILRIAYRMSVTGVTKDERSDSEDEPDSPQD